MKWNAVICRSAHQSSSSHWSRNNSFINIFTYGDLWDVLFALIRHVLSDSTFIQTKNDPNKALFPSLCGCCSGPLVRMGASRNGGPSWQCAVQSVPQQSAIGASVLPISGPSLRMIDYRSYSVAIFSPEGAPDLMATNILMTAIFACLFHRE